MTHVHSLAPAHIRLNSRVRRFSEKLFVPEDLRSSNERGYAQAFSTQTAQSPDASAGASCEEPACDFHHLVPNGGGAHSVTHRPASPREGLHALPAGSPARSYACDPADGNIDIDLLLSSSSPPRPSRSRLPQATQRVPSSEFRSAVLFTFSSCSGLAGGARARHNLKTTPGIRAGRWLVAPSGGPRPLSQAGKWQPGHCAGAAPREARPRLGLGRCHWQWHACSGVLHASGRRRAQHAPGVAQAAGDLARIRIHPGPGARLQTGGVSSYYWRRGSKKPASD